MSDRIGLASLSVDLAGVIAIVLAVFEFYESQKKPDLELSFPYNFKLQAWPAEVKLQRPHEFKNQYYVESIPLILVNNGERPAEFVKVEVDFQDLDEAPEPRLKFSIHKLHDNSPYSEFWNTDRYYRNSKRLQAFFDGKGEYSIGPGDQEIIGKFDVYIAREGDDKECPVPYTIRAKGMDRVDKQLTIHIENSVDEEEVSEHDETG